LIMGLFGSPNIEKMKARRDVPGLIKVVGQGEDINLRKAALLALGELKEPRAVPAITALLGDVHLKQEVVHALGEIGDRSAAEPLTALLGNEEMRQRAADALIKIGSPSIYYLTVALGDNDYNVRWISAIALGKIGDTRAVEPLVRALGDDMLGVRHNAVEALDRLGWQPTPDANGARYYIEKQDWEKIASIGEPAVEPLVHLSQSYNRDDRRHARETLAQIGSPHAIKPFIDALRNDDDENVVAMEALVKMGAPAIPSLVEVLKDENSKVCIYAIQTLVRIGDIQTVEPLISAAGDARENVRKEAAKALLALSNQQAVPALLPFLHDKSPEMRAEVAAFLERSGWQPEKDRDGARYWMIRGEWQRCVEVGAPAVEPLIAALSDGWSVVRLEVIKALERLGDGRAIIPLLKLAIGDPEPEVLKAAAQTITRFGDRAIEPLVGALDSYDAVLSRRAAAILDEIGWKPGTDENAARYWVSQKRWDKCIEIGAPAVEPLLSALNQKEDMEIVRALAALKDKRAVPPLIACFRKTLQTGKYNYALAEALGRIGDPRAAKELADIVNENLLPADKHWSHEVGEHAMKSLGNSGEAAVEALISVVMNEKARWKETAAALLGKLGDGRAVKPLMAVFENRQEGRWSIRKAAADALVKIYRANKIDTALKKSILEKRDEMIRPHDDGISSYCASEHDDIGIGVDFPL
jgi:HEAT repeat protein